MNRIRLRKLLTFDGNRRQPTVDGLFRKVVRSLAAITCCFTITPFADRADLGEIRSLAAVVIPPHLSHYALPVKISDPPIPSQAASYNQALDYPSGERAWQNTAWSVASSHVC